MTAPGWIEVGGGRGYLAVPESGSGPGLILFAGPGRARDFTALADLYAEEGYVTLAVDDDYAEAAKALNTRRETVGQIGAVGFAAGARTALAAVNAGAAACAALYYGDDIAALIDKAPQHGRPVMVHLADADAAAFAALRPRFPAVEVLLLPRHRAGLRRGGRDLRQVVLHPRLYPDARVAPPRARPALRPRQDLGPPHRARVRHARRRRDHDRPWSPSPTSTTCR